MDFISNGEFQIKAMLEAIGISDIEELFSYIPQNLKLARAQEDDGLSELEGMRMMEEIAAKNTCINFANYLGGGAYEHHVPAIVAAICSKSEFLTSYTPYQAEASQGMLQMIFEFQSAICALTGLEVANASLYDGASACAEALLMSLRYNEGRNKLVIAKSLHPHYRAVVEQFLSRPGIILEWIPYDADGRLNAGLMQSLIDDTTAGVLIQSPNFLGMIEDVSSVVAKAKAAGALTIQCANPLAYGIYPAAGELGVDIAIGDTQPFGLSLQFGGPYVGYLACRQSLVRQMPGRLVGETVDGKGRRGFVLTLQAREQHIRREKATSNICTNQTLAAIASLVAILWYGKKGVHDLALTNYQRTAFLKEGLEALSDIKMMSRSPFFNEFPVHFGYPVEEVFKHFRSNGIEPGIDLGRFYPEMNGFLLVAVTETKSKTMLKQYIEVAKRLGDSNK